MANKTRERRDKLRELSTEDMAKELLERRKEQFNLRMQAASGQGVKPDQFGKVRRDIARLKTFMHERAGNDEVKG
jgi:large subunit ribosomal protein L29